eukprot:9731_1
MGNCSNGNLKDTKTKLVAKYGPQVGKYMVKAGFGYSRLDYKLNQKNRDQLIGLLLESSFEIVAIFICSQPAERFQNTGALFNHWCVKMLAPPDLITLGFTTNKGKGAFEIDQVTIDDEELENFLYYVTKHNGYGQRKKWDIIASVTPKPKINYDSYMYINGLQDHDRKKLKIYAESDGNLLCEPINIHPKVCDLACFIADWTEKDFKNNVSTDIAYNALTKNCQEFAVACFEFLLIGNKTEYKHKVDEIKKLMQSPYDVKKHNVKQLKQLQPDPSIMYSYQLAYLTLMGFDDSNKNLKVIVKAKGNLEVAINMLTIDNV